jgi:integrase
MSIIRRGEKTFLVRVYLGRDPMTQKRIEVNETVRGSLSYARKLEAKLKEQKYSGRLTKSPKMTVDALFDLFLDSIRHTIGPSTYDNYESFFNRYARPYISHLPISKIKPNDIQRLFNFLLDKKETPSITHENKKNLCGLGLSPASVKVIKNALNGAFKLAVDNGILTENPVSNIKVRVPKQSSSATLTIEEAKAFAAVKDQFWYGNAFVFQLHTGLRNQELMALIWDDVDFDKGTLRIERACKWVRGACVEIGRPKTEGSNRVIELEAEHLELLRLQLKKQQEVIEKRKKLGTWYGDRRINEWIKKERPRQSHLYVKTNLIFPKSDGRVPGSHSVRNQFKVMLQSAGIRNSERNLRWYDLRHTHASVLVDAGLPAPKIAERMGHSVAMLLGMYTHPLSDSLRRPSRIFADLIPI